MITECRGFPGAAAVSQDTSLGESRSTEAFVSGWCDRRYIWLSQSLLIAVVAKVPQEPDAHFSIVWPAVVQLPFV